jgi:hypothetical protein
LVDAALYVSIATKNLEKFKNCMYPSQIQRLARCLLDCASRSFFHGCNLH